MPNADCGLIDREIHGIHESEHTTVHSTVGAAYL